MQSIFIEKGRLKSVDGVEAERQAPVCDYGCCEREVFVRYAVQEVWPCTVVPWIGQRRGNERVVECRGHVHGYRCSWERLAEL
ncbi:hypothetical protein RSAG8_11247, partial [Rhizoctonia solani AG-8 WAC10335]